MITSAFTCTWPSHIEIVNSGDGMDMVLYYNASRFTEKTAGRMLAAYGNVCSSLA